MTDKETTITLTVSCGQANSEYWTEHLSETSLPINTYYPDFYTSWTFTFALWT
jgi:N-acetylglutamate synthase/N-acetylornithine aminotransferase